MREILDGRLRRQLNILEILWNTEWITTAELAEKLIVQKKPFEMIYLKSTK